MAMSTAAALRLSLRDALDIQRDAPPICDRTPVEHRMVRFATQIILRAEEALDYDEIRTIRIESKCAVPDRW